MAHNGAKMTQNLTGTLCRNYFAARCCEEFVWQAVAYNGSKLVEVVPEYGSKAGSSSWARYGHNAEGTADTTEVNSRHKEATPVTSGRAMTGVAEEDPVLLLIAEPARVQERLDLGEMRGLIRILCRGRDLTFRQLATLLKREPGGLQRWHLRRMVQEGQLVMQYPDNPNHPKQA